MSSSIPPADPIALELPEAIEGYENIISKVSLNRRCRREPRFNKAYMNWAAKAWTDLANDTNAPSEPAYTCTWIKLRYKYGSRDCADANSCSHTSDNLHHCHGARLKGFFKARHGAEWHASASVRFEWSGYSGTGKLTENQEAFFDIMKLSL